MYLKLIQATMAEVLEININNELDPSQVVEVRVNEEDDDEVIGMFY